MASCRISTMTLAMAMILLFWCSTSSAKPPVHSARKENVKYLRCAVCEEIAKQLVVKVSNKREEVSRKKLTEFHIIELAENICNIKKAESEWMFFLDIVQEGNTLKLVEQQEEGECNTKCKTIERTCQEVIGDHDTDVAEFIYKNIDKLSEAAISKLLCKDLSRACSAKQPLVPKNIDLGEPFTPKSSKDADISKLMRSMSDMPGAPGMKMYSKDDLMNVQNFGGETEDDEEEEDEDDFSSLLKKGNLKKTENVMNRPTNLKQRVLSLTEEVSKNIRHHTRLAVRTAKRTFNRASKYMRKWMQSRTKAKPQRNQKAEL